MCVEGFEMPDDGDGDGYVYFLLHPFEWVAHVLMTRLGIVKRKCGPSDGPACEFAAEEWECGVLGAGPQSIQLHWHTWLRV